MRGNQRESANRLWSDPKFREKMTEAQKGRIISQEARDKIAATLTGRKASPETKAKMVSYRNTPEYKEKMSAITKEYWRKKREVV